MRIRLEAKLLEDIARARELISMQEGSIEFEATILTTDNNYSCAGEIHLYDKPLGDQEKFIYALQLFNEKFDKLGHLSFMHTLFSGGNSVTIKSTRQENGMMLLESSRSGPSQEAIDAFVLTIRFFMQDNEECSLRNLSRYYTGSSVDLQIKERFASIRKNINEYLDVVTFIKEQVIISNPNNPKETTAKEIVWRRRDILETFVYGGLSHAQKIKRQRYYSWMSFPPSQVLFVNAFVETLGNFYAGLQEVRVINNQVIALLQASSRTES